jgi:hypothetical protein
MRGREKRRRCRLRFLPYQRRPRPLLFDDEFEDRFEEEFEDRFEDEFDEEFEDRLDELFDELLPATCQRSPASAGLLPS